MNEAQTECPSGVDLSPEALKEFMRRVVGFHRESKTNDNIDERVFHNLVRNELDRIGIRAVQPMFEEDDPRRWMLELGAVDITFKKSLAEFYTALRVCDGNGSNSVTGVLINATLIYGKWTWNLSFVGIHKNATVPLAVDPTRADIEHLMKLFGGKAEESPSE